MLNDIVSLLAEDCLPSMRVDETRRLLMAHCSVCSRYRTWRIEDLM